MGGHKHTLGGHGPPIVTALFHSIKKNFPTAKNLSLTEQCE